jgi:hypothetical protein
MALIDKIIDAYKSAVKNKSNDAIVMAHMVLRPYFAHTGSQAVLAQAYVQWAGHGIPDSPIFAIRAPSVLPWAIAVYQAPPWPSDIPKHAIPVSIIEVAYINMAPVDVKPRICKTIVSQWEFLHTKLAPVDIIQVFKDAGWDTDQALMWSKDVAESYWNKQEKESIISPGKLSNAGSRSTLLKPVAVDKKVKTKSRSDGATRKQDGSAQDVSFL